MRLWAGALCIALLSAVCAQAATVPDQYEGFGAASAGGAEFTRNSATVDRIAGAMDRWSEAFRSDFGAKSAIGDAATRFGAPPAVSLFGAPAALEGDAARFGGPAVLSDGSRLYLSVGTIHERAGVVTPTGDGEAAAAQPGDAGAFSSIGDQGARRLVAVLSQNASMRVEEPPAESSALTDDFGRAAQAPLPASAMLFAAALGGLVLLSFRRSRDAN